MYKRNISERRKQNAVDVVFISMVRYVVLISTPVIELVLRIRRTGDEQTRRDLSSLPPTQHAKHHYNSVNCIDALFHKKYPVLNLCQCALPWLVTSQYHCL
jgi:hypothetical protein